jgi:hypothetical protein
MSVNRKVKIWKHVRLTDGKWRYCVPRIPIHVITTRAALVGAATYGLESLKNIRGNI